MGITQKDIAKALHLPLITVHRALNSSGYVSKELKGRILAYAREVRYVPHKASQVLKRNKVRKIAVFSLLPSPLLLERHPHGHLHRGGADPGPELQGQLPHGGGEETPTSTWSAWRRRSATAWRQSRSSTSGSTAWMRSFPASPGRDPLRDAERGRAGEPPDLLHRPGRSRRRRAGGGIHRKDAALQASPARAGAHHPAGQSRGPPRAGHQQAALREAFGEVMEKQLSPDSSRHGLHNERHELTGRALATSLSSWRTGTGDFDAVYLIAAYNVPFIRALEQGEGTRRGGGPP